MDRTYLPILLLLGFVLVNAILMIAVSHLTIRIRPTPVKDTPYESGIPPLGDARERFSIKFYMVAMLFIIFDIETIFLFPWAVGFRELGLFGLVEMTIFIGLVFVDYVYVWRTGGLDWQSERPPLVEVEAEAPTEAEVVHAG